MYIRIVYTILFLTSRIIKYFSRVTNTAFVVWYSNSCKGVLRHFLVFGSYIINVVDVIKEPRNGYGFKRKEIQQEQPCLFIGVLAGYAQNDRFVMNDLLK